LDDGMMEICQSAQRRHPIGYELCAAAIALALIAATGASVTDAHAQARPPAKGTAAAQAAQPTVPPQAATQGLALTGAPQIAARSWLLADITTGQLLAASEADMRVDPASLTKLMTAYLAFSAIKEKKLALDLRPPVSQHAHKAIGSRMFVDPASPASIDELLNGLIVPSGNDAAIILAEALAGSEENFAVQMNREAQRLGMTNTHFENASGLPGPQHYSTARDLAILAARLIAEHPDFYTLYSKREYTYNNIKQPNRNRLLFIDPTVDGMKTGHTSAAGYCLIASGKRTQPGSGFERRLLSVVMGTASEASRAVESQKLLNYGFSSFEVVRLYQKDQPAAAYPIWKGKANEVKAGFAADVLVTVARGQGERVRGEIERLQPLVAPIAKGQQIGTLRVKLDERLIGEQPILALEPIEQAGWLGRAWDGVRLWIR
jgi:serine-type D-Ala-D-Ala carboxypeptidase (penicillin-binding protein 5/6)